MRDFAVRRSADVQLTGSDVLKRLDTFIQAASDCARGETGVRGLEDALAAIVPLDEQEAATVFGTIDDLIAGGHLDASARGRLQDVTVVVPARHRSRQRPEPEGRARNSRAARSSRAPDASRRPQRSGSAASAGWSPWPPDADRSKVGIGTVLADRYVLEQVLGEGGMGRVFKARDLLWEEARDRDPYVAIKILSDRFRNHPQSLMAMQREARKSARLAHPNIVHVYNFDRAGDTVYMVMELLAGRPLDDVLRERKEPFPVDEALAHIRQMANALRHAHEHGIVHSDFKPGNVFLTHKGDVKVLDFGIARAVKSDGDTTNFDARELGALTPSYASLEMFLGDEPEPNDDIYALGCVAYEMLTGRHPYKRLSATKVTPALARVPPPRGLTRRQWRAIRHAIEIRRSDRTGSVDEFLGELLPAGRSAAVRLVASAAMVAAVGAAYFGASEYLDQREASRIGATLLSADLAQVDAALTALGSLDPPRRAAVLTGSREALTAHLIARADSVFDRDAGRFDYPQAEAWLERGRALFPDSKMLADAGSRMAEDKFNLLNELDARFTTSLAGGRLLPSSGVDNVEVVLETVARVDPNHPLLADPRLPGAYRDAADLALANEDFVRARQLLGLGVGRFPNDAELARHLARVEQAEQRFRRDTEIAALETTLNRLRSTMTTLDDLAPVAAPFARLGELAPDSTVLALTRARAAELVGDAVQTHIDQRNWPAAGQALDDHGPLLDGLRRNELRNRIAAATESWQRTTEGILQEIIAAAGSASLMEPDNAALRGLQRLEEVGAGPDSMARARQAIAQGYLDLSRTLRAQQDWQGAEALIARAVESLGSYGAGRFERELSAVRLARANAERTAEQEKIAQERNARIAAVSNQFAAIIAAPTFDARSIAEAMEQIEEIYALDPQSAVGASSREQLVEVVLRRAAALREAGEFAPAGALLSAATGALPAESRLTAAQDRLTAAMSQAASAARQQRLAAARSALQDTLSDPALDAAWESRLRDQLANLNELGGLDAAGEARLQEQVAAVYLTGVTGAREAADLRRARALIERGRRFAPELAQWDEQLALVEQQEAALERSIARADREARLTGLKQTFRTQIAAQDVARATETLAQIVAGAPQDPFMADTAPPLMAQAYGRLAADAMTFRDYPKAIALAEAGLGWLPDSADLATLRREAAFEQAAAAVLAYFRTGEPDRQRIDRLAERAAALEVADRAARQQDLGRAVAAVVLEQAVSRPDQARLLEADAKRLFPESAAVAKLDVEAERRNREAADARARRIAALVNAARDAEQRGEIAGSDDSAVALYQAVLAQDATHGDANDALNRISERYVAQAERQLADGRTDEALESIAVVETVGRSPQLVSSLKARRSEVQARNAERLRREEFEAYLAAAMNGIEDASVSKERLDAAVQQLDLARQLYPRDAKLDEAVAAVSQGYRTLAADFLDRADFDDASDVVTAGLALTRDDEALLDLQAEILKRQSKAKRPRPFSTF